MTKIIKLALFQGVSDCKTHGECTFEFLPIEVDFKKKTITCELWCLQCKDSGKQYNYWISVIKLEDWMRVTGDHNPPDN